MNKICLGLDLEPGTRLFNYYKVIDETKDLVHSYKINPSYFLGNQRVLDKLIKQLNYIGAKWIYDGKIGDVLHNNDHYAYHIYDVLRASGVTLNPYAGYESLVPFTRYEHKMNFVLCKTSNIGSEFMQSEDVFEKIYDMSKKLKTGILVAGNKENILEKTIEKCPNAEILCTGIEIQGGSINKNIKNENVIYNISRSIVNSSNPRLELEKYIK
jgi:orotidine-5'-phosphate decarboxylase